MLLARVRHIVTEEGFAIHPEKGRVQRVGGRQVVTGVVVNDRPSAPREVVRRLRACLRGARRRRGGLPSARDAALRHRTRARRYRGRNAHKKKERLSDGWGGKTVPQALAVL
ncbi:hypothetical protein WMF20_47250 [Sorangium sp. So ce834]|uniref:hypothetical protein n=1 Tax=Sorangium sp. So ce834 TaxID=3133321 RepID=UPI003F5FB6A5